MFNPIFKENVQRWKHPGSCAIAESNLLSYRKSKRVVQNEKNGHKNPNNSRNYHDENHDEIDLYQGNSKIGTQWHSAPGVGVTKAPFVNFSVSKILVLPKVPFKLCESHLYLTGATAAELRRHLSNINVLFNSWRVFWQCRNFRKLTERRKLV